MKKNAIHSPLGRPLDLRYRSNVLVVVLASLSALAATIYNSIAAQALPSPGWAVGGATFLAWAIGRELDPDDSWSAAIAGVIGGVAAVTGRPSLILAVGVLMGLRLIVGTVGLAMRRSDVVAVIAVGVLLGLRWESVIAVPVLMAGVLIGSRHRHPVRIAIAVLISAATAILATQPQLAWTDLSAWALVLVIGTALATPRLIETTAPESLPDSGQGQISRRRIVIARVAAVMGIAGSLVVGGGGGVFAAGSILAGVVGVSTASMLHSRKPVAVLQAARSQS